MKKYAIYAMALCLGTTSLVTSTAFAQRSNDRDRYDNDRDSRYDNDRRDNDRDRYDNDRRDERGDRDHRWQRGERLPPEYRQPRYVFNGWRERGLMRPPAGYSWIQLGDTYILTSMRNGTISEVHLAGQGRVDLDNRWRARYGRHYTVNDDRMYQECRNQPDPAGVLAGALLGGILGNTAGGRNNSAGTTFAGVIAGGAIGAALTANLECEDRSYAYKTYSDGFNRGRANAYYDWSNPRNGHRGRMHVLDYYEDEDNFRCAVYSHEVFIGGRSEEARGRACQQPDGSWAIID